MSRRAAAARALAGAALVAAALFATATARGEATRGLLPGSLSEWGELPRELAVVLEAKAGAYARRALGFTCMERLRRADYDGDDASDQTIREFEYLLIPDDATPGGLAALRTRPGSRGSAERRPDLDFPEPLVWSQLFDPAIRSTLKFEVGSLHTTPYELAIPISWISSAPVFEGLRISEWSGTIEVEYRTGNVLSITAWPNLQEERLVAELARYLQAFRILGFSTAPPPIGKELHVQFGYRHDGLSYPSRVDVRSFRQVSRDRRVTIRRQRTEYGEYRFFGTRTEEEVIPPLLYVPPADRSDAGG